MAPVEHVVISVCVFSLKTGQPSCLTAGGRYPSRVKLLPDWFPSSGLFLAMTSNLAMVLQFRSLTPIFISLCGLPSTEFPNLLKPIFVLITKASLHPLG